MDVNVISITTSFLSRLSKYLLIVDKYFQVKWILMNFESSESEYQFSPKYYF